VYEAQLDGTVKTVEQAWELIDRLLREQENEQEGTDDEEKKGQAP
jgi:hypothetical protein